MRNKTRWTIAISSIIMFFFLLTVDPGFRGLPEAEREPGPAFAAPSSVNWIAELPGRVTALEVGPEGNAYFMDEYSILRCADPGGNVLWFFEVSHGSILQIWGDRILLTSQKEIVCLGPDGKVQWRIEPPRQYFSNVVSGKHLLVEIGSEGIAVYDRNGTLLWDWYIEITVNEDGNEYYWKEYSNFRGNINDIWMDPYGRCLVHCDEYNDGNRTESLIIFEETGQVLNRLDKLGSYTELVVQDEAVFSLVWNEDDSISIQTLEGSEFVEIAVLEGEHADLEVLEPLDEKTLLIGNGFAPYYDDREAWLMAINRSDGTVLGEYRTDRFFEMETRDGRVLLYEFEKIFDESSISFDRVELDRNMNEVSRLVDYPPYQELYDAGDHILLLDDEGRVVKLYTDGKIVNVSNSERIEGWDQSGLIIKSIGNRSLLGAYGLYSLTSDGEIEWSISLKGGANHRPVQNLDGSILLATDTGELRCYSNTGEISWTFMGNNSFGDPVPFPNGTIAVLSGDRELYCLDMDGDLLWNRTLKESASEVLIGPGDGRLLVLMMEGNLTTIGWGGVEGSRASFDRSRYLEVATSPGGEVFIGSNSSIHCLDPDLMERWSIDTGKRLGSGPVIGFDGTVYYDDGEIHAVSADGDQLWSLDHYSYELVPGPDGALYSFGPNSIERILPNGSLDWEAALSLGIMDHLRTGELTFGDDGVIYCFGDGIIAIGPNGTLLWKYLPPGWEEESYILRYAPVIDMNGGNIIYLSTPNGLMSVSLSDTEYLDPPKVVGLKENSNGGISWDFEEGMDGSVISGVRVFKEKGPLVLSYYRTLDPSTTSYSDRVERRGNISFYAIQTFNAMEEKGPFGPVMTDHASFDRLPTKVNNVKIKVGNGWIRIYWEPPTDPGEYGLTGYRVYRANGSRDEVFNLIAIIDPNNTSYTDRGLKLNEYYFYEIAAENEFGWRRNTSSWGGCPYEDLDPAFLGGIFGAPILILTFVVVIAYKRMRSWKKSSEWVRSDVRPSGSNVRRGDVLYRHWHMLENASGYAMLLGYGLGLLVAVSMALIPLWSMTPSEFIKEIAGNPIYLALALIDILYLTSVLWVPFLLFPTTMVIYSNGIDPGSSRFTRWTGKRPSFLPFREVSAIFPRFDPVLQTSRTEMKGDRFRSFVIVMRDGKRCEVRWHPYNYTDTNDRLEQFREFLSKSPEEFRDSWSDKPLLTEREERLIERARKVKGEKVKAKVLGGSIALIFATAILLLLVVIFLIPAFMVLTGEKDFGAFNVPVVALGMSGILMLIITIIIIQIIQSRDKEIPGLMHQLDSPFRISVGKEEQPDLKVSGLISIEEGRPYDRDIMEALFKLEYQNAEIEKAVRATLRYRKGAGSIAFTCLMITLIGVSGSLLVLFLAPWWISLPLLVTSLFMGAVAGFMEWRYKALSNETHKTVIERTMIREVIEGRKILPSEYRPPGIVGYKRGKDPLKEKEVRRIRWWGRFSNKAVMRLALGSFIGIIPMVIVVPTAGGLIWGEGTMTYFIIGITIIIAGFMLAFSIWLMSYYTMVMSWIDKYILWERLTGIEVLPEDIRRIEKERKSERTKGEGKVSTLLEKIR